MDLVCCLLDVLGIDIDVVVGVVFVWSEWFVYFDVVILWVVYNMFGFFSVDI